MKVKEESEKVGLKLNIQKTKIMTSGPITSWQIDGGTVETVADFIFGGSKITVILDGDCSHEIKRRLLLGKKVMSNLSSILESREELKSLVMKVKEESDKADLKLNIQKRKIMASGPITLQQKMGNNRNSDRLYFLGLQNHCGQ